MKRILLIGLLATAGACNAAVATGQVFQNSADHLPVQKTMSVDQIVLEEYKALRAEIILCLGNRVTIVSLGFAALGALLAGGLGLLGSAKPQLFISALIIGVGVSLTCLYVFDVWTVESRRLARASYHNCYLENKIERLLPGEVKPLEWEHKWRTNETYKSILPSDKGVPWIFLFVPLVSIVGGSILFVRGANKEDYPKFYPWRIPFALSVALLLLWDVFLHWEDFQNLKAIWDSTVC